MLSLETLQNTQRLPRPAATYLMSARPPKAVQWLATSSNLHCWGWLPATENTYSNKQAKAGYLQLKEPPIVHRAGLVLQPSKMHLAMCNLGGDGSQGVTRVGQADFIKPMQFQIWLGVG